MSSSSGVAGAAASALLLVFCSQFFTAYGAITPQVSQNKNYSFPDDFILGVSTAAYQIEGAWNEDGRGESLWDRYLHEHPNYTADHKNGDIATDSYHRYKEDVKMVKDLGVKYYRMSISWPRILPNGTDNYINPAGVAYYRNVFEELLRYNITPMVTLFHWDLPQVFADLGGWSNRATSDYFEDYARVVFRLYGDIVKNWITINEPQQHCANGYGKEYFAPALNSHGIGEYLCAHYILLGHAKVYHLYDKHFRPTQGGKIAITLDSFWAEPEDLNSPEDIEASERYMQMRLGFYAHPIYSEAGDYPELVRQRIDNMSLHQGYSRSRLPRFTEEEIFALRGSSDFFGINHYTTYLVTPASIELDWEIPSLDHDTGVHLSHNPTWPKPGSSWFAVYPRGFRKLFNWITKEYGRQVPIIVTENGLSDWGGVNDYARVSYYNNYLHQLLLAMHEDHCNIIGYFAWTLMDDFEWTDGYVSKFGLYYVDFNTPEMKRSPKLSAYNYKEIVRTRRVNFNYIRVPVSAIYNNI